MEHSYLLAETGGQIFALPSDAVDAVATVSAISPVPLADRHVAGIAAVRSKVMAVVDGGLAIGGTAVAGTGEIAVVVVEIDGHHYGIAVDDVHDVVEREAAPQQVGAAFSEDWRRLAKGFIEINGEPVVVVDPVVMVSTHRTAA